MTDQGMSNWTPPTRSKHGLRDQVAANLDAAIATATLANENVLWEITAALTPIGNPPQFSMQLWLVLSAPSPILGEGSIISAQVCDPATMARNPDQAVAVVRHLVGNIRNAAAQKLRHNNGA